jgi:hypothetical protein
VYRTNAKPPEPTFTWWEMNGHSVIHTIKMATIVLSIILITGMCLALFAAGIQFVVNGFAGHQVGTFQHYFVALFLIWTFRIKRD